MAQNSWIKALKESGASDGHIEAQIEAKKIQDKAYEQNQLDKLTLGGSRSTSIFPSTKEGATFDAKKIGEEKLPEV